MTTEQPNEIPNDYNMIINFCHFKDTWIHERHFSIGSGNEFRSTVTSGIPWMQFYIGSEQRNLISHLREGWPKPVQSAEWNYENKSVEVFADDLFLCPECGRFHGLGHEEQNQHEAENQCWAMIRQPTKDMGSIEWCRLDSSDGKRLREFAASRLNVPQFYLQPCKNQFCQQIKSRTIREFKSQIQNKEQPLSPETQAFLETKKTSAKPATSYTSLVYLIHGSGHYKIGIAVDAKND